ncbi:MAG: glycosyltransferase family 2 protein [Bacteroidetes bacterium]|nr:glycosyltransferase family 2 protein [Bacteroidota bacterium]
MSKAPVTVVILTFNESIHIERAILNVKEWAQEVMILDSLSTDDTCAKAEALGAKVYYNKFETYSKQRNFAIQQLPIPTEWMLFLDADEYLFDDLKQEIAEVLPSATCNGFYLKRRFYFMGKWIKYGGYYPTYILRLFKKQFAKCEREINEHIKVEGEIKTLKGDFADENLKGLSSWIEKHNKYASFEAQDLYRREQEGVDEGEAAKLFGKQNERKRWIVKKIWNPLMPKLIRPFIYFGYRYFFRLGFLDGRRGFIYHYLQGLWLWFLIDAKYVELKRQKNEGK